MTYGSATNRTSAGMVRGCSRRFCAGEGATTKDKRLLLPLYPRRDFNQDLSERCQLGFYQYGSDFRAKGGTNLHQFSLRFRLGRDQRTTPGDADSPNFLAVVTLRVNRGHQYRRLLLTDRSKPVSARRGLPTLTLLAQLGTAFDDKRSKELADSGALVIA